MRERFIIENIMPNFAHITAQYRPKPFIYSTIENKVKKGALRFCVHSNIWLLNFNNVKYHPLQAYINVKTPSSLIFEPLVPARLGMTRH